MYPCTVGATWMQSTSARNASNSSPLETAFNSGCRSPGPALHHGRFLVGARIIDYQLEQKAVGLRLGQRIGAFLFDRVLRGHDEKRLWQRVGLPADVTCRSCIASSKALCTLAGARLISSASTRLAKIGPRCGENSPVFGWKIIVPTTSLGSRSGVNWMRSNCTRGGAERFDEQGLREAGHALEEHVPVGEQGDQEPLHYGILADHGTADFIAKFL